MNDDDAHGSAPAQCDQAEAGEAAYSDGGGTLRLSTLDLDGGRRVALRRFDRAVERSRRVQRRGRPAENMHGREKSQPPSANRGVDTPSSSILSQKRGSHSRHLLGDLISCTVDALTITCASEGSPDGVADWLLSFTEEPEPGTARPGFAKSERRTVTGGHIWRRMEPHQPSKRFGKAYESWEVTGEHANTIARHMPNADAAKCTRVDVAFDFFVTADVRPEAFMQSVKAHTERGPWDDQGISGERGINTCYVGSSKSERRLRIYRKDLQSSTWEEIIGPVLRIELMLRRDYAARWWMTYAGDATRAKFAAGKLVTEMIGVRMLDSDAELVELELPHAACEAQQLALFVEQHGAMLKAMAEVGIDPRDLVQHVQPSRMTKYRQRQKVQRWMELGVDELRELAVSMLAKHSLG